MPNYQEITPTMTASNLPSPYVASASAEAVGNEAWRAFDKTSVAWLEASPPPEWLKLDLGAGNQKAVVRIVISSTAGQQARYPVDFTFDGSNDNSNWTVVLNSTGNSWASGEEKAFTFSNTIAYRYYRLSITTNSGGGAWTDIQELKMYIDANGGAFLMNFV